MKEATEYFTISKKRVSRLLLTIVLVTPLIVAGYYSWYIWEPLRFNRGYVSSIYFETASIRSQIEAQIKNNDGEIDLNAIKYSNELDNISFSKDGSYIVYSRDLDAFIKISPEISSGNIRWICSGIPETLKPHECRIAL